MSEREKLITFVRNYNIRVKYAGEDSWRNGVGSHDNPTIIVWYWIVLVKMAVKICNLC